MTLAPLAQSADLTIRALTTLAVSVPLKFALGTSAAVIREAPMLLIDLETREGVTGRAYLFCYTPGGAHAIAAHLRDAFNLIEGETVAPRTIARKLARRFALIGVTGTVRMALSGLDVALWDALAISLGQPLATLLGAEPRPIRAYNSSGLGLMAPEAAADEAELLLERSFKAVKLRLGYATLAEDLTATRAMRRRAPSEISIMADYNQALTVAESLTRGRALQDEGLYWLEEPTRHDDYRGNTKIARALTLPLQIGENFNGPEGMLEALSFDACDYVMPDLARIGGVTGWLEAAGIAAARSIEMSSHLFPEVSAHLLAATPTCHWLEYVDWADAFLEQKLEIIAGDAVIPQRPGHGMSWDKSKVAALRKI